MASRLSTEGAISGTVFYLPPELALGQEVDSRADLYALGVLLVANKTQDEALRESWLENVYVNQEIVADWATRV